MLWNAGTCGIHVEEESQSGLTWIAYFPGDLDPQALTRRLRAGLDDVTVESATVPEVDWVLKVREDFHTFRVGGFLVTPSWKRHGTTPNRRVIRVEPSRAFGTGTHETTRLCLLRLEARAGDPLGNVLDLGTGSGILAVAAARCGARFVTAVDSDPEAIPVVQRHVELNGVDIGVLCADGTRGLREHSFDTVLANLTKSWLVERRDEVPGALRPGGLAIISGFLRDDLPSLHSAYSPFGHCAEHILGEWAALEVQIG